MRVFFGSINELPEPLRDKFADELDRLDVIAELTSNYLLNVNGNDLYSMHRLVQQVIRFEMGDNTTRLATILKNVVDTIPEEDYYTRDVFDNFASLAEHAVVVLEFSEKFLEKAMSNFSIVEDGFCRLARGYFEFGDYAKALKYYMRGAKIAEKIYGLEDDKTARRWRACGV